MGHRGLTFRLPLSWNAPAGALAGTWGSGRGRSARFAVAFVVCVASLAAPPTRFALCATRPAARAAHRPPATPHRAPAGLAARLEAVSRRHLGTPYRLDPLGEGPGGAVDRDPLYTWRCADCVTFVEECLAEALAPAAAGVPDMLRRIRYRDGRVAFESRNHY